MAFLSILASVALVLSVANAGDAIDEVAALRKGLLNGEAQHWWGGNTVATAAETARCALGLQQGAVQIQIQETLYAMCEACIDNMEDCAADTAAVAALTALVGAENVAGIITSHFGALATTSNINPSGTDLFKRCMFSGGGNLARIASDSIRCCEKLVIKPEQEKCIAASRAVVYDDILPPQNMGTALVAGDVQVQAPQTVCEDLGLVPLINRGPGVSAGNAFVVVPPCTTGSCITRSEDCRVTVETNMVPTISILAPSCRTVYILEQGAVTVSFRPGTLDQGFVNIAAAAGIDTSMQFVLQACEALDPPYVSPGAMTCPNPEPLTDNAAGDSAPECPEGTTLIGPFDVTAMGPRIQGDGGVFVGRSDPVGLVSWGTFEKDLCIKKLIFTSDGVVGTGSQDYTECQLMKNCQQGDGTTLQSLSFCGKRVTANQASNNNNGWHPWNNHPTTAPTATHSTAGFLYTQPSVCGTGDCDDGVTVQGAFSLRAYGRAAQCFNKKYLEWFSSAAEMVNTNQWWTGGAGGATGSHWVMPAVLADAGLVVGPVGFMAMGSAMVGLMIAAIVQIVWR